MKNVIKNLSDKIFVSLMHCILSNVLQFYKTTVPKTGDSIEKKKTFRVNLGFKIESNDLKKEWYHYSSVILR